MQPKNATSTHRSETGFRAFASENSGQKRGRSFWIKLAASLGLIGFILSQAELNEVRDVMVNIQVEWLLVALVLQFAGPALITTRWQGLLRAQQITPPWRYLYQSTLISTFFRQFLPSIVGGDAIRGYDAWRAGASVGLAFMSLVLDRLFGLIALAIFTLVVLSLSADVSARLPGLWIWAGVALIAVVFIAALLLMPQRPRISKIAAFLPASVLQKFSKIGAAVRQYKETPHVFRRALLLSLLLQLVVITFYWALAMALNIPISYASFFAIAPIAIFVMMLPISINGIGIREGIFVFLLAQWDVSTAAALSLAWLEYGIFLCFGLLGGVLYGLRRP